VPTLAAELRELILDARLSPGLPLREESLSAEYGVNRHTVRAALQLLAAQRLVRVEPYKGARVREFSDDDVRALMEYRTALEGEAVVLLRTRAGAGAGCAFELPSELVDANRRLRTVCHEHPADHRAIERAHADLHHALVASAASPRISEAHAQLESELLLFLNQLRPLLPADEMVRQHDRLLEGIRTRGEEALREHLAASAEQLIALHHER
jgi:DNA-binding GntR family transcriptional regulator